MYISKITIQYVAKSATIVLKGNVQGVGLRYTVKRMAVKLKISGCVENMKDYTVRISCTGEKNNVEEFVSQLKDLKEPIIIDGMDIEYSEGAMHTGIFQIVYGDITMEIAEGFATGGMYFERMLGKQEEMNRKQEIMIEKQEIMIEKQEEMNRKQDETIDEIRNLGSTIHDTIDKRFEILEKKISEINARIGI